MDKLPHHLTGSFIPLVTRFLLYTISTGAGFLPSTVSPQVDLGEDICPFDFWGALSFNFFDLSGSRRGLVTNF